MRLRLPQSRARARAASVAAALSRALTAAGSRAETLEALPVAGGAQVTAIARWHPALRSPFDGLDAHGHANPGMNADRGPAVVAGARLHL